MFTRYGTTEALNLCWSAASGSPRGGDEGTLASVTTLEGRKTLPLLCLSRMSCSEALSIASRSRGALHALQTSREQMTTAPSLSVDAFSYIRMHSLCTTSEQSQAPTRLFPSDFPSWQM